MTTTSLNVVAQVDEVAGAVERLTIEPPVPGLPHASVTMLAVDVVQHAAEKFHAIQRMYAEGRPSSRVKDLVDLVLLVEAGLLVEPARLGGRIGAVSAARDGAAPRPELARPPAAWDVPYAAMATDLGLAAVELVTAYDLVAKVYVAAVTDPRLHEPIKPMGHR